MLFLKSPFFPIYRLTEQRGAEMIECRGFDIESQRFILITLRWDAISSDDASELAQAMLDHTSYQPDIEDYRWWIDSNYARYR